MTGVLGVPPDPRLIEVAAWFASVVPVGALVRWPASRRPIALPGVAAWSVPAAARSARLASIQDAAAQASEHRLWGVEVPVLLVLVAAATALVPVVRERLRRSAALSPARSDGPAGA